MKKNLLMIPTMCLLATSLAGCKTTPVADLVVINNIFTAESSNNSLAESFAVKNGKYIYVGDKENVKKYIKEGKTKVINGNGLVIPGATEGHAHYIDGTGQSSELPGCGQTYEEVLVTLKNKFEKEHITQFISFGWKTVSLMSLRDSGYDFATEIEAAAPGIPVVLIDDSGHSAVCNKTALTLAGITKENPTVRGGAIYLTDQEEPSGYVGDQAVFYVVDKTISRPLTDEQYRRACTYGMNELLKYGYTNALDAFTNMYDPTGIYETLQKMDNENLLKINIAECYNMKSFDSKVYQEVIDKIVNINKTYSSKHCDASYIKLFADGVVESGTGWISHEYKYPIDGKTHGNIIWEPSELNALTSYANKKGLTIHTHSYGDAACKATIDAYIKSNQDNKTQYRNCLAHVRNITDEDIIRAAENKIPITENLFWHTDYNEKDPESKMIKDYLVDNMGEDYYYSGYPMKSLMDKGVIMSSSTDAPAALEFEPSILNVIEVATTGMAPEDDGQPFAVEELLTIKEVLMSLTINGAWQLGLENERGSIKVGKYADFVILDKNILNYQGEQLRTIHNAKILNTYFEGENVFEAK